MGNNNPNPGQYPDNEGDIADIYEQMQALEQPYFEAINPNFHAFDFIPDKIDTQVYPYSFRFPPEWVLEDRGMGSGARKPFTWQVGVVILVGRSSNSVGKLTKEAQLYIEPFYKLYLANRSINDTVKNLSFGKGYMGDITIESVKHYGLQFPVSFNQFRRYPYRLG